MRAEKAASFQPGGSFDPVEGFHQRILVHTSADNLSANQM